MQALDPRSPAMDARTDKPAAAQPITAHVAAPAPAPGSRRRTLFMILGAVVVIGAVLFALDWLLVGSHHVTTDDAYVDASTADVTPLVSGPIISDPATDTMPVKKGDVLVVIDPSDFKLALAADEAALGQAQRRVEGYFANRDAQGALTQAKGADVDHARAMLSSAEADVAKAQTDLARRQAL